MRHAYAMMRYTRGFSLVEMMVAVTIGLIILAAVSGIFVTSKSTYNTTDSLARLQENARFAVHYLQYPLRMAGYYGCLKDIRSVASTVNGTTFSTAALQIPIDALKPSEPKWYPSTSTALPTGTGWTYRSGTDAILIRTTDPSLNITIRELMPSTSRELKVTGVTGLSSGDIIMLADCSSADLLQLTAVQTPANHLQHNTGAGTTPGNFTAELQKQYDVGAKIIKFKSSTYFIATRTLDGVPVLMRQDNTDPAVELIEGVEDLQIRYGVDTDSDGVPNIYLKAGDAGLSTATDWTKVRAVRIGLLMRTLIGKEEYTNSETYLVLDKSITAPGDRHHRRVFNFTLQLRNLNGEVAL